MDNITAGEGINPKPNTNPIKIGQNKDVELCKQVRLSSLTKEEKADLFNKPQYCICGCGTILENPVTTSGYVTRFAPLHQVPYLKKLNKERRIKQLEAEALAEELLNKNKKSTTTTTTRSNNRKKKYRRNNGSSNNNNNNKQIQQLTQIIKGVQEQITALQRSQGSMINKKLIPKICIRCKSKTTYFNPNRKQFKWYTYGNDGYQCQTCYQKDSRERRRNELIQSALQENNIIETTKIREPPFQAIPKTTIVTSPPEPKPPHVNPTIDLSTIPETKNDPELNTLMTQLERQLNEINQLRTNVDYKNRVITEQSKNIHERIEEIRLLKQDVKTLENEITSLINNHKENLRTKDDVIKSQSDEYNKLEIKYQELDQQFQVKYVEWKALNDKVSELEALKQELQNQLDKSKEAVKLATDTVISQHRKLIDLEEKNKILQREKESWVKTCADEEKKKEERIKLEQEEAKRKALRDLTFKPVN